MMSAPRAPPVTTVVPGPTPHELSRGLDLPRHARDFISREPRGGPSGSIDHVAADDDDLTASHAHLRSAKALLYTRPNAGITLLVSDEGPVRSRRGPDHPATVTGRVHRVCATRARWSRRRAGTGSTPPRSTGSWAGRGRPRAGGPVGIGRRAVGVSVTRQIPPHEAVDRAAPACGRQAGTHRLPGARPNRETASVAPTGGTPVDGAERDAERERYPR